MKAKEPQQRAKKVNQLFLLDFPFKMIDYASFLCVVVLDWIRFNEHLRKKNSLRIGSESFAVFYSSRAVFPPYLISSNLIILDWFFTPSVELSFFFAERNEKSTFVTFRMI